LAPNFPLELAGVVKFIYCSIASFIGLLILVILSKKAYQHRYDQINLPKLKISWKWPKEGLMINRFMFSGGITLFGGLYCENRLAHPHSGDQDNVLQIILMTFGIFIVSYSISTLLWRQK
jgi:hypothetical protein